MKDTGKTEAQLWIFIKNECERNSRYIQKLMSGFGETWCDGD